MSSLFRDESISYGNQYFYCPSVYAKDGFHVSLQINNGSYCESNKGYRELGDTMISVEFGFPSMNEELMFQYSEMWDGEIDDEGNMISSDNSSFYVTGTVGRIPIEVMEKVFEKHGGIDWDKTISIESFNRFISRK